MKYIYSLLLYFTTFTAAYSQSTMEDTIKYQIGQKLHFTKPIPTGTPITAIYKGTWEDNVVYAFIVHDKYSPYHAFLSIDSVNALIETDKQYLPSVNIQYLKKRAKSPENTNIDKKVISRFKGYWHALVEYNGNYYVENSWDIPFLIQLTDSTFSRSGHEGFIPYPISKFKKDKKGIIQASYIIGEENMEEAHPFTIELIDKKRSLYKLDDHTYITPLNAIHNYEIIVYCNNTGDLIVRPDFNKKYQRY